MKTTLYNGYKVNLVETVDDIDSMLFRFSDKVQCGVDTETNSLDYNLVKMAGLCLSGGPSYSREDYQGYYLPVRHTLEQYNLPLDKVLDTAQTVLDNFRCCFWNRPYDFTVLEKEGIKVPFVGKTHDVQCMAHLVNSEHYPALKDFAKRYLKFNVIEFSSNKADEGNFATTDPSVSFAYAAQDPLVTVLLGRKLWSEYPYIQKVYPIDNKAGEAVRRICRDTLCYLDFDYIQKELDRVVKEQEEVRSQIFAITGYTFRLTSNQDKIDAISRFVTLTKRTATGKFKLDDEVLSSIDHPLARLFQKYSELEKYRGTYLAKLLTFPKEGFHVNYSTVNVPTGRLSSGASKGNSYFANLNIQNIIKQEERLYLHRNETLGYNITHSKFNPLSVSTRVETKLGTKSIFNLSSDDEVLTLSGYQSFTSTQSSSVPVVEIRFENISTPECWSQYLPLDFHLNLGDSHHPDYRKVSSLKVGDILFDNRIVAISESYNSQSVEFETSSPLLINSLVMENMSVQDSKGEFIKIKTKTGFHQAFVPPKSEDPKDPWIWISADYSAEELRLAANFSGESNFIEPLLQGLDIHTTVAERMFGYSNPDHRTATKVLNFSILYGANEYTLASKLNKTKEEAKELIKRYFDTNIKLFRWQQNSIKEGRRKGITFTYFGRPRTVYQYYGSGPQHNPGYGDRTCLNHPIQGDVVPSTKITTDKGIIPLSAVSQ